MTATPPMPAADLTAALEDRAVGYYHFQRGQYLADVWLETFADWEARGSTTTEAVRRADDTQARAARCWDAVA